MSFCNLQSVSMTFGAAICASVLGLTPEARATDVGGPIFSNTTWTAANSPYIVTSAIIVGANATLTIQPGVIVKFNAGLGITVGSGSFGAGTLKALGTSGQPITFTSSNASGAPGQWKDIFFTSYTVDAAFDDSNQYTSGSILRNCIIEYAGGGASGSGAVTISECSPYIKSCEVRYSARSGIYAVIATAPLPPPLRIQSSNLHHNSVTGSNILYGAGAFFSVSNGLVFDSNTITHNTSTGYGGGYGVGGISLSTSGTETVTTISGNTITHNTSTYPGGGMFCNFSGIGNLTTVIGNTISDNTAPGGYGGGGMYAQIDGNNGSNSFSMTANTIQRNAATQGDGGGIYLYAYNGAAVSFSANIVEDNIAKQGGGLYLYGYGVYSPQSCTLTGNTFVNNSARGFSNNDGFGGGIYLQSQQAYQNYGCNLTLISNTIVGNIADGGPSGGSGYGGGLYVTESTPSANTAVTLTGNQATGNHNILSGNSADFGGAIYNNMLFAKNGSNDIHAEYVCWGGIDPNPTVDPNLIYDFFDNPQKAFVVYPPHVAGSGCPGSSGCGPGEILDCNGNCAPASWLGDYICDDGAYVYLGNAISFDCPEFSSDNGDCAPPEDPFTAPPNQGAPETTPYDEGALEEISKSNTTNLVVVVHGWNTDDDKFDTTWKPFATEIATNITAPGTWTVQPYDWTDDCGRLTLTPLAAASEAASTGFGHGLILGKTIAAKAYNHVHLIGHSAGSALISAAARAIRVEAQLLGIQAPKIHCTYLDAFVPPGIFFGGMDAAQMYGADADFADQYYVKSLLYDVSGGYTSVVLPNAVNVNVTAAVGDYPCGIPWIWCGHSWPIHLYRGTVTDQYLCKDGLVPMLHDLSKEHFTLAGDWLSYVNGLPQGPPNYVLTCQNGFAGGGGESDEPEMVPYSRIDPPLNLAVLGVNVSAVAAVTIASSSVILTTEPSSDQAWVNFEFITTQTINQLSLTIDFNQAGTAVGLFTAYMDGKRIGRADEPSYLVDGTPVVYFMGENAAAGTHVLSFRLDDQAPGGSTVQVSGIATGYGAYVPVGDINGDGIVNGADISALLSAWGPCAGCAADLNHDGNVGGMDLTTLLSAWTPS